jgi:C-terminal processing protease CtpA/Prc
VGYLDSTGSEKKILLPMWLQPTDTSNPSKKIAKSDDKKPNWLLKKERRESYRSMVIDTALNTATFTLNTFSGGGGKHLTRFIKQSFKQLKQAGIHNLIIDLRSNGGGDIDLYAMLTKYIRNTPFKVADSAYAVTKSLRPYTKYIRQGFFTNLGLLFLTKKRADGNYHFGFYERHTYHPKTHNHFDGKVYVLINGPTFSASTLFCHAVKGQPNVTIAGEEAGGGWHGNSGIMIPDITLPNTNLKVRLPLFKIVQYNHVPKDGRGLVPDIYIPPSVEGVVLGLDRKMMLVKELIKENRKL